MNGLNNKDMEILQAYAEAGNRERYWNYLANHAGADGYGLLALGVVRNDNMPGAVANSYAQSYAKDHDHLVLDERGWEAFGRDLVRNDFQRRALHMAQNEPQLALNLPVADIQDAHAQSFGKASIGADAWTPNILLNAARAGGGEPAVEKVWHTMLDSRFIGVPRLGDTTYGVLGKYGDYVADKGEYMGALIRAERTAAFSSSYVDPNHINRDINHYEYDARSKGWTSYVNTDVAEFGFRSPSERVTDPALIRDLNDAREVRLERQHMAAKVHPDDPYREIAQSPHTVADTTAPKSPSVDSTVLARFVDPALYDDLRARLPEGTSPDRLAQVTLAARQADIRGGDIQGVSLQNTSTLLVHGRHPGDRAVVDIATPPPTVEQTVAHANAYAGQQTQQWAQFHSEQQEIEAQAQQQAQTQTQSQSGPAMSGPRMG
ncbi:MAG: hypothetical protein AAGC76_17700 [Luteibacter sp.]|uniref:hypothetical protein n=1 Tax=unclassified Luteibacter TaxID=2620188 RepID=UPI0028075AFF|nr:MULTISPECIES: hypothetical protein [unclassified Luteibacter]MDQ7997678.1 hypothetical protein [Luteibacter sp.]MDQ8049589.1 hypothetical protein [Luteibacter sp.]MDR6641530.1 hypothetical protein [Luteibacter sp. 1214]